MYEPASSITPRRTFIGRMAAGAFALGMSGVAVPRTRAEPVALSRHPDLESWPNGLTGKHRQVFDAVSPNDGFSGIFANVFLDTNNQASKLSDRDLNAVVVLRHAAAILAFTDPIWKKYKLGEAMQVMDANTHAPALRNPYFNAHPGDLALPGGSIEKLQARGVIFGVCTVALTHLSGMRAAAAGVSPEQARDEWVAAVIPGITILPSGVWGVNRAQERGCTYCYAG
jgi:intracellular sulfur oxidation DsrE/DsrF family protein